MLEIEFVIIAHIPGDYMEHGIDVAHHDVIAEHSLMLHHRPPEFFDVRSSMRTGL